jgi:biotin operon repressor
VTTIITEQDLEQFRGEHLSPAALLKFIELFVSVLLRIGVGVGKSHAVDELLLDPRTYERFDLVVYAAPAWNILNERSIIAGRASSPVPHLVIKPRPTERCGPLNDEWAGLEERGCAAYAKATLCRRCPHYADAHDPCLWPKQLRKIEGVGLVFVTEQQLLFNRSLIPLLMTRTGAKRVLTILDEGRLLDAQFEVVLRHEDLERYGAILQDLARRRGVPHGVAARACELIVALIGPERPDLSGVGGLLPRTLSKYAFKVQSRGLDEYGNDFRYIGYDLSLFPWSHREERWRDDDAVHFIGRPYLHCHLLVLSGHLTAAYVGHRLGRGPVSSPFEHHRFQHTGTRVFNLRSRIGADRYFGKNRAQILDTFALLIARNIEASRSTLLICKKKSKLSCASYLEQRLREWGYQVEFVLEDYSQLPGRPDARVIPVIHYGVLGVNDFTEYQSAYCLNSYYVSTPALNRELQEFEPESFRVQVSIVSGPERVRRVVVATKPVATGEHEYLGDAYLHRLEIDPVIQAAGRVRFNTKPREVVFFQMAQLQGEIPGCHDVLSLVALRRELGIPDPTEVDAWHLVQRARSLLAGGRTREEVAAELGVSRTTLWRLLGQPECFKNPIENSLREFETSTAIPGAAEGES